jgi:hypothetical protein
MISQQRGQRFGIFGSTCALRADFAVVRSRPSKRDSRQQYLTPCKWDRPEFHQAGAPRGVAERVRVSPFPVGPPQGRIVSSRTSQRARGPWKTSRTCASYAVPTLLASVVAAVST